MKEFAAYLTFLYMLFLLTGCAVPMAMAAANASGFGTAEETKLMDILARNYGVESSKIKITNVTKENHIMEGSNVYFDADINGQKLRCLVHSSWMRDSPPLCKTWRTFVRSWHSITASAEKSI
jgi:hypothetical protein